MGNIDDLRAQVRREQAKAQRKVKRLKEEAFINNAEKLSPAKSAEWVKTARSRDLQRQLKSLQQFNSRQTNWVGDMNGRPIPAKLWNEYKAEERKWNKTRREYFDSVKGIRMDTGVTVEQASKLRSVRRAIDIDDFKNQSDLHPGAVWDEKGLRRSIKALRKANNSGIDGLIKKERHHFENIMGSQAYLDKSWLPRVRSLSDEQFMLLWTSTDFKVNLGENYEMLKDGVDELTALPYEQSNENITNLLDWVEKPATRKALSKKKGK